MIGGSKSTPKDVQAMCNILKDFNVLEYEHSVLNQMLEFTYRYVTNIIEDAVLYSTHAKKKAVDAEDVKLAITLQQDKIFASPPSRELTAELARGRNVVALPQIRSSAGLRLPPDRHALTACNVQLKSATKKIRTVHTVSRLSVTNVAQNSGTPRPTFNVQKSSVPSPIIKFSEGNKVIAPPSTLSAMPTTVLSAPITSLQTTQILMPTVGVLNSDVKPPMVAIKRPHEDDDYDN